MAEGCGVTLAQLLKKGRTAKGVTQAQVAEAIGVAAITVSIWERGVATPSAEPFIAAPDPKRW